MDPSERYTYSMRSFFTDRETKDIGNGVVLWRGYFQSVRPGIGRMLINVDISTGMMYKPGPLIGLCLEYLGSDLKQPLKLAPAKGLPERQRLRLQLFLSGLHIITPHNGGSGRPQQPRVIKKLSTAGADATSFSLRDGRIQTVAQYFHSIQNRPLKYPSLLCVEVSSGALLPLEVCQVPSGQLMKKELPMEKTKAVVDFSKMNPPERFRSIVDGLESEYVRQFGMSIETQAGPLSIKARVLSPPTLKYGPGSKLSTITPKNGAWNMLGKHFFRPAPIERWVIVIYERKELFTEKNVRKMVQGLVDGCRNVGITVQEKDPLFKWENGQGNIADMGVATQCLRSMTCRDARPQYWANVCLKINPKLGGINNVIEPSKSLSVLTDPHNPTIIMGADVVHPPPGSKGRPSFTSVVGSMDSNTAKYIATSSVQTSRQEMIDDMEAMCTVSSA
ncbi:hypothetical protein H0H81_008331 [Sphagnurus paluster]|uniref:Uncharacterized protein n=1 Tax=Sphagnurus paluster TaxID=117069 RepID=A0A9P7GPX4_9AGAR|nr:hypothetical protein H0H81_008331 [Sphagnurus paluster]